jgi:hypothetical protein
VKPDALRRWRDKWGASLDAAPAIRTEVDQMIAQAQAGQRRNQFRLPVALHPGDAQHFPGPHLQRDAVDGCQAAIITDLQIMNCKHRVARRRRGAAICGRAPRRLCARLRGMAPASEERDVMGGNSTGSMLKRIEYSSVCLAVALPFTGMSFASKIFNLPFSGFQATYNQRYTVPDGGLPTDISAQSCTDRDQPRPAECPIFWYSGMSGRGQFCAMVLSIESLG